MAQVVYAARSIDDLGRLAEFLVDAAPESARSAVDAIIEAFGILERHPLLGRRIGGEMRELVISRGSTGCLALHRFDPSGDTVRILRIRHQREAGYVD
ncbi:MAG: type II toxin-antitoxin system RelE/ParE family toxin [Betaproteobacteria bacterium]|nr:type II toxin-antitoxin system RelE/ParE family toxin [Betaproteobacteria bacterium]